ncbi:MAG: 1-acyl-sn-glycerol-3-phosphate acyltransferase [Deltaproteobacteria bacterium]|nr:1-acyl-sn-glycerol-3-phosphate acyltransferase [Candidatus Anaeroferrophillus wilburensis]MBN2888072.1 1-acyl-sn-glycerol-3-phosphate acyltransferase [Deltaproteobacteria bacterium]
MEKSPPTLQGRIIALLFFLCRLRPVRWFADRCCLNQVRMPKADVVEVVTDVVLNHYREHKLEAALDARQARVYQKVHFRQQIRALQRRLSAVPSGLKGSQSAERYEKLVSFYRTRSQELNDLDHPAAIIDYLAGYYIEDMAANFDPAFFVVFRSIARRIFPNFVNSIRLSESEPGVVAQIRELMGKSPVFILPNHVSNADHIPICFAINGFGGLQPVIAAGANLFRGVSADIMPKVNAYKIRREQIGADSTWFYQLKWFHNPIYRRVHTEYLHHLWDRNEPMMFYIEGTRSRDGSIGEPKWGIMEDIAAYIKKTGRHAYLVPVSISYTVVPEDVEIEASRSGKNISEKDLVSQLARLDRHYKSLPDSAIHVRFSRPIMFGPDQPKVQPVVSQLMHAISQGMIRTYTSMLATAIIGVGEGKKEITFTLEEIHDFFLEYFSAVPECRDQDVAHQLMMALTIFLQKGFVVQGEVGEGYQVANPPLIEQYARRIGHLH